MSMEEDPEEGRSGEETAGVEVITKGMASSSKRKESYLEED